MLLSSSGGVDSAVQLITVLIIFILVLFITFYVTKWMAGFQKQQMTGTNIKLLETMRLSQSQFIQIIKVGEHYLAIAVSKEQVTLLAELSEDELKDVDEKATEKDFSKVFARFKDAVLQNGNDSTAKVQDKDENI